MKNKFKANIYEADERTLEGRKISCNIINDDMTKPPKWFQHWSETVYQKQPPEWFRIWSETVYQRQPPQWFQVWSETEFKPLKNDVNTLKSDVNILKKDVSAIKNIIDHNIQSGVLEVPK